VAWSGAFRIRYSVAVPQIAPLSVQNSPPHGFKTTVIKAVNLLKTSKNRRDVAGDRMSFVSRREWPGLSDDREPPSSARAIAAAPGVIALLPFALGCVAMFDILSLHPGCEPGNAPQFHAASSLPRPTDRRAVPGVHPLVRRVQVQSRSASHRVVWGRYPTAEISRPRFGADP
jgi:hypothetical protein